MKIVKPFTLGLLHRTYRQAGENRMVACVLGFFTLGQPQPARLLPEADQWARLMKVLPTGQALDEVMPKASAEAIVFGQACAPGGQAVTHMRARLQVGAIDKRLSVYGDRQWRYGTVPLYTVDAPAPFTTLPLDWAHAFGGAGYATNPLGKGYNPNRLAALAGANQGPMPNVEYADERVRSHTGSYAPAALGPMPIDWDARKRYAGTYDQRWLQQDYPGLPRDLDWRLYNQAAADQRLPGWFSGGETYRLEGMHPDQTVIEGRLPGYRVRAFALPEGKEAALREFALQLDTVWFIPGLALGVAAWRGQMPVSDIDGMDVQALMVAYEDGAAPALTLSHYSTVMALRTDQATAPLHAFNESQLAPPVDPAPASTAQADAAQARLDEAMQEFWEQSGMTPPAGYQPPKVPAPVLDVPTQEAIASGDIDLTRLMKQADELQQAVRDRGQAMRDELAASMQQFQALLPDGTTGSGHATPAPRSPGWDDVLARADGSNDAQTLAALAVTSPSAEVQEQARTALGQRAAARLASPTPVAPAQALTPEVAVRLGRQVLAWAAAGVPLAGRDLAGADLRGANLAGLDLSGCLLEYADLSGADLSGARLTKAVLTQATLSRASLAGADLTGANLCASTALDASLARASLRAVRASSAQWAGVQGPDADLTGAVFDKADLSQSCFDGATLEGTVLTETLLAGSRWRGAAMKMCVAWKAQAHGADFSRSSWQRSAVIGSDLTQSRWEGARLSQMQGGNTDWAGASLRGIRAERSSWPEGQLQGVDLGGAFLTSCDLSRANLQGATLQDGSFPRSLFLQSRLGATQAQRADFFQSLLRKADFTGADLREASLYQADLTGVCLVNTQTQGLRLDPTRTLK